MYHSVPRGLVVHPTGNRGTSHGNPPRPADVFSRGIPRGPVGIPSTWYVSHGNYRCNPTSWICMLEETYVQMVVSSRRWTCRGGPWDPTGRTKGIPVGLPGNFEGIPAGPHGMPWGPGPGGSRGAYRDCPRYTAFSRGTSTGSRGSPMGSRGSPMSSHGNSQIPTGNHNNGLGMELGRNLIFRLEIIVRGEKEGVKIVDKAQAGSMYRRE